MRKYIAILLATLAVCLFLTPQGGRGDDTEVMVGEGPPPNVLIVLDNSGSMYTEDPEHVYDENKTYTPWAGMPDKGSNYENWRWYHKTRWQIAKNVVTHLLEDTEGVRFGLMRMDGTDMAGVFGEGNWGIPNPADVPYEYAYDPKAMRKGPPPDQIFSLTSGRVRQGGKLLQPVGTSKQDLIDYVNGMEIYKTVPHTYTNLAETLFTAGQYFSEGHGPITMGQYKDSDDTNWPYGSYWANNTDDYGNVIDTSSPIQYWCQRNYVIFITDGQANADSDWQKMLDTVGDYDGDGYFRESHPEDLPSFEEDCDPLGEYNLFPGGAPCDPVTVGGKYDNGELINPFPYDLHSYIDDVAQFLYETDLRNDMDGTQNIITYTVGFSLLAAELEPVKELLSNAATQGGGAYYTADDYEQLRDALQDILYNILVSQTTAFGSPVVPVQHENRSFSGNEIYVAMFKSEDTSHMGLWAGNLKKFGLATAANPSLGIEEGDILDAKGDRATNEAGTILNTARSFWRNNNDPDGGNIFEGGAGEVLLVDPETSPTERNVYTYLGEKTDLTDPVNAFTHNNMRITCQMLGVPCGGSTREKVINYIRGFDAFDEDDDNNTSETRSWILGDINHSNPVVFSYNAEDKVIFVGANDGMLHAFDAGSGKELWAYMPPIFFRTARHLSSATHRYFIDGSPTIWYQESGDSDTDIEEEDGDQVLLICGLRRGGEGYLALDVTNPQAPKIPEGWKDWLFQFTPAEIHQCGMIGRVMSKDWGMHQDSPYEEMGETWSKPKIGKVRIGDEEKWVAFVGGGYDPNEDFVPPLTDTQGRAVYCFDIQNGDKVWEYTHASDGRMNKAIPSDVALLDTNCDGRVDRLYLGDLGGRIWRFDVGSTNVTDWTTSAKIVFNANAPTDGERKIFYPPDITEEASHFMLLFGTGDRSHPNGKDVVDRLYVIKDRRDTTLDEDDLVDVTLNLLQDDTYGDKDTIRANLRTKDGWFIKLDESAGEKALSRPIVFGGIYYITTFTPADEAGGVDPCATDQGTAKLYALNYLTGEAILNLDLSNDPLGEEALEKSDRSMVIGSYIPSDLVLIIQGRDVRYYVSVGTDGGPGIKTGWPGEGTSLYSVFWRELF